MRKTKQQIIEHLELSLRDETERRERLQRIIDDVKRELFSEEDLYGSYRHKRDTDDILSEARRLKIQVSTQATDEKKYLMAIENENERLWRLVRSLTGDFTLRLEVEHGLKSQAVSGISHNNHC